MTNNYIILKLGNIAYLLILSLSQYLCDALKYHRAFLKSVQIKFHPGTSTSYLNTDSKLRFKPNNLKLFI